MKILNIGSLNIDRVYNVKDFVQAGETISTDSYQIFSGGKGLNQSIALAKSGVSVFHCGMVGADGKILIEELEKNNVDISNIKITEEATGHAVIQVNEKGENCIIVCGGANRKLDEQFIKDTIDKFAEGDFILMQNETNNIPLIMEYAKKRGLIIVFNPSPIDENLLNYPINLTDYLILNETEGGKLAFEKDESSVLLKLTEKYPDTNIVLTLGEKGSVFKNKEFEISQPIFKADVVDTTAAGDSFSGFFIGSLMQGKSLEDALKISACAASIAVSRKGAAGSIPYLDEVMKKLKN